MKTARILGIAPQLAVPDVAKTAVYYRDVLGFTILGHSGDSPAYAMVERDGIQVHFGKVNEHEIMSNEKLGTILCDFILWVPEIELFFEEVKNKGGVIDQEIVLRPYGREFIIRDCDGHRIMIVD